MAKGLMDNGVTLVTNGTENHMCLLDLRPQDIKGKLVEKVLDDLGICTNKNSIPDDTASPLNPNGLRIGVPVITTRGLNETDCNLIGKLIAQVITNIENESIHKQVAEEVAVLCKQYPLYVE